MATQSVKDILNTDIPKPLWVWSPTTAAPTRSDMSFSRGDAGDPGTDHVLQQGEFAQVGPDKERVYRGEGMLLEPQRTNDVTYSAKISRANATWDENKLPTGAESTVNGLIEKKNGYKYSTEGGTPSIYQQDSGTFLSNGPCAYKVIFESPPQNAASFVSMEARDQDQSINFGDVLFDVSQDPPVLEYVPSIYSKPYVRKIIDVGPNGGPVYEAGFGITETDLANNGSSGNSRWIYLQPDAAGNSGDTIFHYAGIEDYALTAGSPIPTGANSATRNMDYLTASVGSVYNPTQPISIFFEFIYTFKNRDTIDTGIGPILDIGGGYLARSFGNRPQLYDGNNVKGWSNKYNTFGNNKFVASFYPQTNTVKLANNNSSVSVISADARTLIDDSTMRIEGPAIWKNISIYPRGLSDNEMEILVSQN